MAATLTTKLQLHLTALLANTIGAAAGAANIDSSTLYNWTSGVIADAADKIYSISITRTHGSPTGDLDLAGTLTDAFGATITMVKVKALIVLAAAANINSIVVGGGAAAPITSIFFDYVATALAQPAIKVKPGGMLALVAPQLGGYALTATSADKIQIANGDEDGTTSATATVIVIGVSA